MSEDKAPKVDAEVVQWQEDYNTRVEEERRREAERALKGRARINAALDSEDASLTVLRGAAQASVTAAGYMAMMEQEFARDIHAQWQTLSIADKKTALRLLARTSDRAINLTTAAVKLERTRQKNPLRPPATAETILADPAKGLELLEEAAAYVDKLRGLEPTKIVTDELMAEIDQELDDLA